MSICLLLNHSKQIKYHFVVWLPESSSSLISKLGNMTPAMFSVDISILMNARFTDSLTFVLQTNTFSIKYIFLLFFLCSWYWSNLHQHLLELSSSPISISELDKSLLHFLVHFHFVLQKCNHDCSEFRFQCIAFLLQKFVSLLGGNCLCLVKGKIPNNIHNNNDIFPFVNDNYFSSLELK